METAQVLATKQVESGKPAGIATNAGLAPNSLAIVIPALNEEEAIASTITRVLRGTGSRRQRTWPKSR